MPSWPIGRRITLPVDRLRFKHLRLIAVIAQMGNLHRAAEQMNMTQPAATKMLQDIETTLRVQLFERHARGLTRTELGEFVIDYARQSLTENDRFMRSLSSLKRGGFGSLAIGAVMATAPQTLPAAIAELKKRRPLMTVKIVAATSDLLLAGLEKNELDLVIGRFIEARHGALFDIEPLATEILWAFAASDHPLAGKKQLSLADLGELPWVLQPPSSPMRQVIDQSIAAAGLKSLDNLVETTSIYATLQLVMKAGMISVLPHSIVLDSIARGEITRLPVSIENPLTPYGIVTRKDAPNSANAFEFIEALRRTAGGASESALGQNRHPDRA